MNGQVKPLDCDTHRDCERGNKMVSEVYLTRLLTTKVGSLAYINFIYLHTLTVMRVFGHRL